MDKKLNNWGVEEDKYGFKGWMHIFLHSLGGKSFSNICLGLWNQAHLVRLINVCYI